MRKTVGLFRQAVKCTPTRSCRYDLIHGAPDLLEKKPAGDAGHSAKRGSEEKYRDVEGISDAAKKGVIHKKTIVMSFGDGSIGALGHVGGYLQDCFEPEVICGLPDNIVKVSAGHYHSLAVTQDGQVWAWGRNTEGQLGPRDENSRKEWCRPARVRGLDGVHVKEAVGSGVVSTAIAQDGSLWAWGTSKRGQLGLAENVTSSLLPRRIEALSGLEVSQVALGWGHALACTTNGQLYAWGYAKDNRLGFTPNPTSSTGGGPLELLEDTDIPKFQRPDLEVQEEIDRERKEVHVWKPYHVNCLSQTIITSVACGLDHSLVLAENGDVLSFGDNSLGQLGNACHNNIADVVKIPPGVGRVVAIAAGLGHSLAVAFNSDHACQKCQNHLNSVSFNGKVGIRAKEGTLLSWGWNSGCQLGRSGDSSLAGIVDGLNGDRFISAAGGRVHSTGLSSRAELWVWGSGRNGRLGLGSSMDEPMPSRLELPEDMSVLQVACGFDHTLVLATSSAWAVPVG